MDRTVAFLRELVAIDSVNPSLVPGGAGEREVAGAVASELEAIGLDVDVTEVEAGRPNVVGVLQGRSPGRTLMLCGHLDTVGVEGMTAPFEPVERGDRMYGRGAQDMKGGIASMVGAARALAESGGLPSGRLVIAGVVDEEYASVGAEALVTRWRADAAVVTEPTDLRIAVAHKGFAWVEVQTSGRAAHGSRPLEGRDAILRMGRVLGRLEALDRQLQAGPTHPLVGSASLHASTIAGGRELSVYPDQCLMHFERRTIPGESSDVALREAEAILEAVQENDVFDARCRQLFGQPSHELPGDHALPRALGTVGARFGLTGDVTGTTFWTDAAILGRAGIPAVVFGPGGAGLHATEEYVKVPDVLTCRDVLADLARELCR